jgi:hypothetical protein
MQKLLLLATLFLATLSLGTLACAEMGEGNASDQQRNDNDWYSQTVALQAEHSSVVEDAISPVATEFAEPSALNEEQPGAMASNEGSENTGHDWYGQQVAVQAELNRRLKKAEIPTFEAPQL